MADSKLLCVSHKVTTSYTQLVSYIVIINIQSNWFTEKYKPRHMECLKVLRSC